MDNEQVRGFLYQLENNIERAESDTWTVLSLDVAQGTTLRAMLRNALADSDELAKLRAEIAGAAVVPITRQVDFTGGIPISWDDHRFETTFAKLLPCDADGTLLRLPAGEPGESA